MKVKPLVFLSYARPDKEEIEHLYQRLSDAGFRPWMDTKDILPGEIWEAEIEKNIHDSYFFLACLSKNSVNRRGYLQKEIREGLKKWEEKLEDDIYLIPIKLEDCTIPEQLRRFQEAKLFEDDGWGRLRQALHKGMRQSGELAKDSLPVMEGLTPSNMPTPTSIIVEPNEYTAIVTLTWDYVQGEIPADRFVVFQSRGSPLATSDSSVVVSVTSKTFILTLALEKTYRFGIAAANGANIGPIIQPSSSPDWEIIP